ncbi:hypothetical protein PO909_029298, partial [Leuciscus waleckii]
YRLAGCRLSDRHWESLSSALQSSNHLRELDLSNNILQTSGVKLLCTGLERSQCQLNILRFDFHINHVFFFFFTLYIYIYTVHIYIYIYTHIHTYIHTYHFIYNIFFTIIQFYYYYYYYLAF